MTTGELLKEAADRAVKAGSDATAWDARLLLAMLGLGGAGAEVLREHGLDEAAVRGALGGA